MLNFVFISIAVAVIGYSMLVALIRKLIKSRIRGIMHLSCGVLAIAGTLWMEAILRSEETIKAIHDVFECANLTMVIDFMDASGTLSAVILNCAAALVAPLVCLLLYIVLCAVTWVIYFVITLVIRPIIKRREQHQDQMEEYPDSQYVEKHSHGRTLIWGAVSGLVTVFMLFIPITAYIDVAIPVLNTITQTTSTESEVNKVCRIYLDEAKTASQSGALVAYRALGGKVVCNALTSFEIDDEKISLGEETGAVAGFVANIIELTKVPLAEMDHERALIFEKMADSFAHSEMLPAITGEVVFGMTDRWIQGESFAGMAPIHLGDEADLAQPLVDKLIVILHDDAHNETALEADFRTIADIIILGVDHGVFSSVSDSSMLSGAMGNNAFLNAMLARIEQNSSMSALLPEFTNMAFRSIAMSMDVPGGDQEAYNEMMGSFATSLNNSKDLTKEERNEVLTQEVEQAMLDAGMMVGEGQRDALSDYVDNMATELLDNSGKETITEEDVKLYMATHMPSTIPAN